MLIALRIQLISVRLDLIIGFYRSFEDIHFEYASPSRTIWKDHNSNTLLDALAPCAHVCASISPSHHTVPLPLVFDVASHIDVARLPLKRAMAVLLVIYILAFIGVAPHRAVFICLPLLPLTMTILHSSFELACVAAAIHPLVLPKAFRLPVNILANEDIAICEEVTSIAVPKGADPFSFVLVAIAPDVDTVSLGFGILPLTDVALTV